MFLGLRTVIYHVSDIEKAKEWYRRALGFDPYFDQPCYVGFNVNGYELGLDPDTSSSHGGTAAAPRGVPYWGVQNAGASLEQLLKIGATLHTEVQDVGEGILMASVVDPFGNILGIIENPHFSLKSQGEGA